MRNKEQTLASSSSATNNNNYYYHGTPNTITTPITPTTRVHVYYSTTTRVPATTTVPGLLLLPRTPPAPAARLDVEVLVDAVEGHNVLVPQPHQHTQLLGEVLRTCIAKRTHTYCADDSDRCSLGAALARASNNPAQSRSFHLFRNSIKNINKQPRKFTIKQTVHAAHFTIHTHLFLG
jgi:hypothetical protein